jgi:hypothetical protein
MNKKRKKMTSSAAIALSVAVFSFQAAPAHAAGFDIGGLISNFGGQILGRLGGVVGEKLGGYLELGLGKLDNLLGVDVGSVTGDLGIVDPLEAKEAIDNNLFSHSELSNFDPLNSSTGEVKKGLFSAELSSAITSSVLSKDGQSAMKENADAVEEASKIDDKLAADSKKQKISQKILQNQSEQLSINNKLQANSIAQQKVEIQQEAAGAAAGAVTAKNTEKEQQRKIDEANSDSNYTLEQQAAGAGIIGQLGK